MTKIITSSITRSSDAELLKKTDRVAGSIKAESNLFPTPDPALPDIEKAAGEYRQALQDAGSRDKTLIELKNQKKAALISLLIRLAAYINFVSKGDRAIMLSSGFEVSAEKSVSKLTPAITGMKVETPNTREAVLIVGKIAGARAYMYQYTDTQPTPDTIWTSENSLLRKHKFVKLKSDARHWFRVVAVGSAGQVVYSEPVSRVIQ